MKAEEAFELLKSEGRERLTAVEIERLGKEECRKAILKVIFYQDLDFVSIAGGAELTDRAHFIAGIRRGHDITLVTPSTPDPDIAFAPADLVIVSNASMFQPAVFQRLQELGRHYVMFLHDYWFRCQYRLFYPMVPRCMQCHYREQWLPALLGARFIIWLSPLHRESWLKMTPELTDKPYALVPSPVSSKEFFDMGLPRKGVIAVNSMLAFKGRKNIIRWIEEHPDQQVTLVGADDNPGDLLPPNAHRVARVPQHELNDVYNRHEAFLHLPNSPMPFDRTCAEAYLAGCHVIGNELVGALSWPFFKEGREAVAEALADAPNQFWKVVEGCL